MKKLFTLSLLLTLLVSCSKKNKEILIMDLRTMKPAAGVTVKIHPGTPQNLDTVSKITNEKGIAVFGQGNWDKHSNIITIQVIEKDKVLIDSTWTTSPNNKITLKIPKNQS